MLKGNHSVYFSVLCFITTKESRIVIDVVWTQLLKSHSQQFNQSVILRGYWARIQQSTTIRSDIIEEMFIVYGMHNQMEAGDHQHNDAEYLPRSKTSTYVLPRKVTCIHFKNSFSMTLHVPLFRFIKKCHIICQIIFVDRECLAGLKWKKK